MRVEDEVSREKSSREKERSEDEKRSRADLTTKITGVYRERPLAKISCSLALSLLFSFSLFPFQEISCLLVAPLPCSCSLLWRVLCPVESQWPDYSLPARTLQFVCLVFIPCRFPCFVGGSTQPDRATKKYASQELKSKLFEFHQTGRLSRGPERHCGVAVSIARNSCVQRCHHAARHVAGFSCRIHHRAESV